MTFAELQVMFDVGCRPCEPGQHLVLDVAPAPAHNGSWWCASCPPGTYILDSNDPQRDCMPCPAGGTCVGGAFTPSDDASTWEVDAGAGIHRLVACPAGSMLVNSHDGTA
eukprot:CAMPEP_0202843050 /NCGR_PEP_ID=MMETSP1389-20130828/63143_1 /ASSEMBLY_ACC=CAM_ASM_000865 /TAXON_ID=302021 /ORGANISM="Rhodomonas sp., Strain CCMP768" /LENGTH=109 /DNA_ID=CAMNT_0049520133 /DNA_START=75 /DNA_END=401 /DNA_ORIENTATION=-